MCDANNKLTIFCKANKKDAEKNKWSFHGWMKFNFKTKWNETNVMLCYLLYAKLQSIKLKDRLRATVS